MLYHISRILFYERSEWTYRYWPQIHVQGVIEEQYRRIASILKLNANVFGGRQQTNKQVFDNVNAQIEVEFVLEVIVFFYRELITKWANQQRPMDNRWWDLTCLPDDLFLQNAYHFMIAVKPLRVLPKRQPWNCCEWFRLIKYDICPQNNNDQPKFA